MLLPLTLSGADYTCLNTFCGGSNGVRATPQAAHGNPGASPYAGSGAQQQASAQQIANLYALTDAGLSALLGAGGINWMAAPGLGVGQLMQSNQLAQYVAAQHEQLLAAQKPLDHAGTTFGEIVGWRIWGLSQGYLTSYSADYAWLPGHPAEGDVSDHGSGGIWAFKDAHRAFKKALESVGVYRVEGWVTGSVWMYGEVVEHQIGYRSQYATVRSIEAIVPNERQPSWRQWAEKREMRRQSQAMLEELRERYIAAASGD